MTKEDVPFRAMLALTTFKKTGRTPDVEFFESEYFQKAANEADFNEMSEGFAAHSTEEEIQDTIDIALDELEKEGVEDGEYYRTLEKDIRDDINEGLIDSATELRAYNKYAHKRDKPIRKELSDTANQIRDAAADTTIAMAKDPSPQSHIDALMEGDIAGEIAADIPGIHRQINPWNRSDEFFTALGALLKKHPDITPNMIVKYMQPAKEGYHKGYKRRSQERINGPSQ